jgi:hypothetical protein
VRNLNCTHLPLAENFSVRSAENRQQSKPSPLTITSACRALFSEALAVRKRVEAVFSLAGVLACLCLWSDAQSSFTPEPHEPAPQSSSPGAWQYSFTVDGYLFRNGDGYAQPTFTADHKWLHLETRYNYENFRTGSFWVGYNFAWGKSWQFQITPMIGAVFGRTQGIAPGCEAELNWRKLNVSISNEYLFDTTSTAGNFYYVWNQVTYQPLKWFRFGYAGQRNKMFFQRPLDHQEGLLLGVNHKRYQFTTYVLDPGGSDAFVQFEIGATF